MINLLPPKEKEMLLAERKRRLAAVLGITALSFLICLVFILLAIYFFALGEVSSQKFYLQEASRSYQSSELAALKAVIQKYNKIFPQIYSFYSEEKHFSDALNIIYGVPKPEGISFSALSLDGTKPDIDKNEISVSIRGTSDTRENLLAYQNSLLGQPLIKNVSFSPESWISSQDVSFNITFNLLGHGN